FEGLRQADAQCLGRIASKVDRLSVLGDGASVLERNRGGGLIVPGDNRREAVTDSRQRAETREETEERGRCRDAEAKALPLAHEAAVGIPVADGERPTRAVRDAEHWLELPRPTEEYG